MTTRKHSSHPSLKLRPVPALVASVLLAACVQSDSEPAPLPEAAGALTANSGQEPSMSLEELFGASSGELALPGGGKAIPADLVLGGDCPEMVGDVGVEIAAQAAAKVPLKVGLTLTSLWNPTPFEEYECLKQVTAVDRDGIDVTSDCDSPDGHAAATRRICRADLDGARMLLTGIGWATVIDASGEELPEIAVGTTFFNLSRQDFAELKETGSIRHRYVQPNPSGTSLEVELIGNLQLEGRGTARVAVNDRLVDIPVVRASGEVRGWKFEDAETGRISAVILDDPHFPFLVDYQLTSETGEESVFRLNHAKVSYPDSGGESDMERQLEKEKRIDVYGIYFDFNSDCIRRESGPVLEEIADLMRRNPDWTLHITGHTDNVGGDAYNLDLSRRRSEAVRNSLVAQYGIASERLATGGLGAAAPKDTNETPEGRARNRRVELVRQ